MFIDLRSDTVTLPSDQMLGAMMSAPVGDDVFKEDPSVNELQDYAADLFGVQSALFFPSGTMANQAAIKVHTRPGEELICEANAHVHYYEGGGIASNSGVSTNLVWGDRGVFSSQDVAARVRPDNVHFPSSRLVCIENTCNRGGGKVFPFANIQQISLTCKEHGLKLHLDGARLFNAMLEDGTTPRQHGELFDSLSICLSKGLGAPVGSLLLGSTDFIARALRVRKVFGGGMRQAGIIAAAGLYALKNNVSRLALDHSHAGILASTLEEQKYVRQVLPQETNIVVFELTNDVSVDYFLSFLKNHGIYAMSMGPESIRFVTHLGIGKAEVIATIDVLRKFRQ